MKSADLADQINGEGSLRLAAKETPFPPRVLSLTWSRYRKETNEDAEINLFNSVDGHRPLAHLKSRFATSVPDHSSRHIRNKLFFDMAKQATLNFEHSELTSLRDFRSTQRVGVSLGVKGAMEPEAEPDPAPLKLWSHSWNSKIASDLKGADGRLNTNRSITFNFQEISGFSEASSQKESLRRGFRVTVDHADSVVVHGEDGSVVCDQRTMAGSSHAFRCRRSKR